MIFHNLASIRDIKTETSKPVGVGNKQPHSLCERKILCHRQHLVVLPEQLGEETPQEPSQ